VIGRMDGVPVAVYSRLGCTTWRTFPAYFSRLVTHIPWEVGLIWIAKRMDRQSLRGCSSVSNFGTNESYPGQIDVDLDEVLVSSALRSFGSSLHMSGS